MPSGPLPWPYLPTLARLALALAIGLFVGVERERRRKEAGLRTFAFTALLGAAGGLVGEQFALLALGLIGVLVVLLNVETIHTGEGAEITTSAALLVIGFAGVLAGMGHTFTPTVLGVATAGLLAWKEPLASFSHTLTESEFRSAVLLAIIAFVIYPVLPEGSVDPWHLVEPRAAWVAVILIAALGFGNYVLFKLYGARGIALTGFLGGLVNSTVTVTELANRVRESAGRFARPAFKGVALATAAMLVRNGVLLALLSASAFRDAMLPLALMLAGTASAGVFRRGLGRESAPLNHSAGVPGDPVPTLQSPFSPVATLKLAVVFLAVQIACTAGQRALGAVGFYAVSLVGGIISSASAVASAANLVASGVLSPEVAAIGAVIASGTSAAVDLPIVARLAGDRALTRRLAAVLLATVVLGALGVLIQTGLRRP